MDKKEILKEATKETLNINEGSPLQKAVLQAMQTYSDQQLQLYGVGDSHYILITDVPNFRKELITMIQQVRYQTGIYNEGSSTEIAERFEHTVNCY